MNKLILIVLAALLLATSLSACASQQPPPAPPIVVIVQPPAAPAAQTVEKAVPPAAPAAKSYTDPNEIAFAQAKTCEPIPAAANPTDYVEATLKPGQTYAGDIEVWVNGQWVVAHDSGIGEYTVVRNIGTTDVKVRAHWGAGCLVSTDYLTVIQGEWDNPNHTDLVSVRNVTMYNGVYVEDFITSRP